jgi:phosphatidylserine/phosphatidylglycerophosphate/cardiolipin synthase-like enzyme
MRGVSHNSRIVSPAFEIRKVQLVLHSELLSSDPLLEQIAMHATNKRISKDQNHAGPSVRKIQQGLLLWDPDCLPKCGADGEYGDEAAEAVARFKKDMTLAEEPIHPDVDSQTVLWLDAIALAHEQNSDFPARAAELDNWLSGELSGVFSPVSSSDITVHISGTEAFASLYRALSACADDRAIILLACWDFHESTVISPGVTIGAALHAAANRGAKVRALFNHIPVFRLPRRGEWRPMRVNNSDQVAFVNHLPGGVAIHDRKVLHRSATSFRLPLPGVNFQVGSHHQKAWAVWTGERLTAWCGGIDIHPNQEGPHAFHDVQVELNGIAAAHLYEILRKRWEDHPDRPAHATLPALAPTLARGTHRCRVLTTYGNPTQFAGLNTFPYSFAPYGSKAIRQMLLHLISKAQDFIYIEDQYFVDESVGRALAARMSELKALIIVLCDINRVNMDLRQGCARRRAVFNLLLPHAEKIAAVYRNDRFLHAKLWIFDDTIGMVSSANINRRGMEHDSEMGVVFGDLRGTQTAREMRERLWQIHLGDSAPPPGTDPVEVLPIWKAPPAGSAISIYDWTAGSDPAVLPGPINNLAYQFLWEIIDPHCP